MIRLIAALAVSCLLLLALALWQFDRANGLANDLATATDALEKAQKRTTTIQVQVQKSTTASQKARQVVKEKLDAVPEFRDTAVPVPVRDSLCERIRCK